MQPGRLLPGAQHPRGRRGAGRRRGCPRHRGPRLPHPGPRRGGRPAARPRLRPRRDGHFDTVSAFIKSLRGNDPDAALYWLAAMVAAGEDPRFIARRLIISASEDVGNADPRALQVAVAAAQALDYIGLPEASYALAQATTYIATAPKSNRAGGAYWAAAADVVDKGSLPVPNHLRNAADRRMKHHGIGVGYRYPHDYAGHDVDQQYLPDDLVGRRYYLPSDQGYEKTIGDRIAWREGEREAARASGRTPRNPVPGPAGRRDGRLREDHEGTRGEPAQARRHPEGRRRGIGPRGGATPPERRALLPRRPAVSTGPPAAPRRPPRAAPRRSPTPRGSRRRRPPGPAPAARRAPPPRSRD